MNDSADYCELCDLPKSQCPHGQPPPVLEKATSPPPKPRRPPATRTRPPAPATSATRRWTSPEVFKPLILTVLRRAGGELEADELFVELETLAGDRLLPEDRGTTPGGELRWHYAARRARVALIDEGLMTKTRPGLWQLARPDGTSG